MQDIIPTLLRNTTKILPQQEQGIWRTKIAIDVDEPASNNSMFFNNETIQLILSEFQKHKIAQEILDDLVNTTRDIVTNGPISKQIWDSASEDSDMESQF